MLGALLSIAVLALASESHAGEFILGGGSLDLGGATLELGCADVQIDGTLFAGTGGLSEVEDLDVPVGGVLNGESAIIEVTGSWTVDGTFDAGTSTVSFVDGCGSTGASISGSNTFNDLSITTATGKLIRLDAGETTTVTGTLALGGASGNLLVLRSSVDGSEAFFDLDKPASGDFVDVQDNHAVDQPITLGPNSVDSGNTLGWSIGAAVPVLGLLGLLGLAVGLQWTARRLLVQRTREPL